MEWTHDEGWSDGTAFVIDGDRLAKCSFELGMVTTGRQRVFKSFYVLVILPCGIRVVGEDRHNLLDALRALAVAIEARGYRLFAAGLDDRFSESGLSHNSGMGYIEPYREAFHIMDVPPYPRNHGSEDSYVADSIREAVAGMCQRPPFVRSTLESTGSTSV